MIGQLVGQYRITEKLGEGGMGAVYKAVDIMIEREVAIKMLRPEIAGKPDLLQRFRSEAITLAKLNHAGIATLYNFMQQGENFFMVMEYVPGRTLEEVERERGALPWQLAVPLFEKILDAVQPAHEFGILHRDIKPANIMLTTWGAVKVMDFGIARMLGAARMTREGSMVGTIEYIAPERVKGKESDARGDIYSLGVVLFELLCGRLPFQCDSEWELMRCHLQDPLPALQDLRVDVPREVEEVVRRATAKSPESRFSSCDEFIQALRSATSNLSIAKKAIIDLVGARTVQELGTAGHVTLPCGSDRISRPVHGIPAEPVGAVTRESTPSSNESAQSIESNRTTPISFLRSRWRLASIAALVMSIWAGLLIGGGSSHGSQPEDSVVPERIQPAIPSSPLPGTGTEPDCRANVACVGNIFRSHCAGTAGFFAGSHRSASDLFSGCRREEGCTKEKPKESSQRITEGAQPMTDLRKHAQILASAVILLLSLQAGSGAQESAKPITEKGLISALTIGGLESQELVEIIDRRGVDFALTREAEQQLRAAGATDAVLEAVRTHSHQPGGTQIGVADPIALTTAGPHPVRHPMMAQR